MRRAKQQDRTHRALSDSEDIILHGRLIYSLFKNPTGWYTCVITTEGLVRCATAAATSPGMAAARAMEALVRSSITRKKRV